MEGLRRMLTDYSWNCESDSAVGSDVAMTLWLILTLSGKRFVITEVHLDQRLRRIAIPLCWCSKDSTRHHLFKRGLLMESNGWGRISLCFAIFQSRSVYAIITKVTSWTITSTRQALRIIMWPRHLCGRNGNMPFLVIVYGDFRGLRSIQIWCAEKQSILTTGCTIKTVFTSRDFTRRSPQCRLKLWFLHASLCMNTMCAQ